MKTHDFLLELGTEELPPKLLLKLSNSLKGNFSQELEKLNISSNAIQAFATPRRLAITVSKLQSKQQDQVFEKRAPQLNRLKRQSMALPNLVALMLAILRKKSSMEKNSFFSQKRRQDKILKTYCL